MPSMRTPIYTSHGRLNSDSIDKIMILERVTQLEIDFVVALNHLPWTQISNQIYLASEVQLQIDTTITMQRQTHPTVCKQRLLEVNLGSNQRT